MKKYTIEVTRTDEFEIEIDEKVWTKEALADWSDTFSEVESVEDVAKVLAEKVTLIGSENFIEGFGWVKQIYFDGSEKVLKTFHPTFRKIEEHEYCKGIVMKVIFEDQDYSTEITKEHNGK